MFYQLLLTWTLIIAASGDAKNDLQKVIDDFWFWKTRTFPVFGSYAGVREVDHLLTNISLAAYDEWKVKIRSLDSSLKAIDSISLIDSDRLNYRILGSILTTLKDGSAYSSYAVNPVNLMEGVATNDITHFLVPHGTDYSAYENIISRLSLYPTWINQVKDLMRVAIATGKINSNYSMYVAVDSMEKTLNQSARDSKFFDSFRNMSSADFNETLKDQLKNIAEEKIRGIYAALTSLKEFTVSEYMPRTRPGEGVGSLPDGLNYYQACLRWHTTTNLTPTEVYDRGVQEVLRIETEMNKIKEKQGFNGNLTEFFRNISGNPAYKLNSSQAYLDEYNVLIDEFALKLPSLFNPDVIPKVPVEVKAMPYKGPGGSYFPPVKEGKPGTFYAEVSDYQDQTTLRMRALTLHEASPGHHFQVAGMIFNKNLPPFRRFDGGSSMYEVPFAFPYSMAYAEGWGLYAEFLGEEMGAYRTDMELLGRYSMEIFRAARLVVDTGLHAFNWTRQQALDYMLARVSDTPSQLEREIDRYISLPGQACAYKIGELKFKELRQKAKKALGDSFNVKDFHSTVLNLGAVPLDILESEVDAWIATVKGQKSTSTADGRSAAHSVHLTCLLLLYFVQVIFQRVI